MSNPPKNKNCQTNSATDVNSKKTKSFRPSKNPAKSKIELQPELQIPRPSELVNLSAAAAGGRDERLAQPVVFEALRRGEVERVRIRSIEVRRQRQLEAARCWELRKVLTAAFDCASSAAPSGVVDAGLPLAAAQVLYSAADRLFPDGWLKISVPF